MTWAVIGAGYAGIAVAGALIEAGVDVDVFDERPVVGGLWVDGVYDSVSLITSRRVSAYPDHPMPPGPAFPSGPELLAYLTEVAAHTGVTDRLRQRRVGSVARSGDGWSVDGEAYDGVALCTGLFSRPLVPSLPGTLSMPTLHTRDYRSVEQLGSDVLVVGFGNSGADVARDCVASGRRVTLAVHRDRHVIPRAFLGRPVTELARPAWLPDLALRLGLDLGVRLLSWRARHGRLGPPRHLILAESDVVHDELLPLVRTGAVAVRPAVTSLAGAEVGFADGSSAAFDTVVWATGYDWSVPIDRTLLDGHGGPLRLVGGALSPVSPALAAVGFREPRNGRGAYYAALGSLVAAAAVAQPRLSRPVGAALAPEFPPDDGGLIDDVAELPRLAAMTRRCAALH